MNWWKVQWHHLILRHHWIWTHYVLHRDNTRTQFRTCQCGQTERKVVA